MEFKCPMCSHGFYYKQYMHKHLSRIHGVKNNIKKGECKFVCLHCDKRFTTKKTLATHVRNIHQVIRTTLACQEENCDKKFSNVRALRTHLCSTHGMKSIEDCKRFKFEKYFDFLEWLAAEENKSNAKFVNNITRKQKDHTYKFFKCHRSGVYKPKVDCLKMQLKAKKTKKIGFNCTASISVKVFYSHIEVSYYKEHYKHESSLCHLSLPQVKKESIAGKSLKCKEYNLLESIKKKISILSNKINSLTSMDDNVSKQVNYHLLAIEHLLKVKSESSFSHELEATSEPANKKVNKQKQILFSEKIK